MNQEIQSLLTQIASTLSKIEGAIAKTTEPKLCDFHSSAAFSWKKHNDSGYLQVIEHPQAITLKDLIGIDRQKEVLINNTEQFIKGYPTNNVLLWGAKGTGKSSIIKALLNSYADQGIKLIEVDRHDLVNIPDITHALRNSEYKFIIFCDDLSFESADVSYKALKVALDGGLNSVPPNVLIYATSNRRHLLPEMLEDNNATKNISGEIHYADVVEEKISLSERFGIWLSFYPFNDTEYLAIAKHWVESFGITYTEQIEKDAIFWCRTRASKSGRCAYQFAVDLIGKKLLRDNS